MTITVYRDLGRISSTCTANRHGTYSAFRRGCRCPHAIADHRRYQSHWRNGHTLDAYTDGTGTRRRLQALAVLGWRWKDIAVRMGTGWRAVQHLAIDVRGSIHVNNVRRVAAVYRELCDRRGPSAITARRSAAKGWHGPLAWHDIDDPTCEPDTSDWDPPVIDEWAVAEAIAGRLESDRLAELDLVEAMRRLLAEGLSEGQARYRLRLTNAHARRLIRAIPNAAAAA